MGPNPTEGETTGEFSEGLMTEKGEAKTVAELLEVELLGCCEDMAWKRPAEENLVLSEGYQSDTPSKHC